jgi:hypothetical protein
MTSLRNNVEHCRDEYRRKANSNDGRNGRTAGFEYAVQKGGISLAERRWRELRRQKHSCFSLHKPTPSSSGRYQPVFNLESVSTLIEQQRKEHASDPQLLPQQPTLSTSDPSILQNTDQQHDHAAGTPMKRIRNRHNAVYGEHLPNAFNSPACAAKVFGKQSLQNEERNVCQSLITAGTGLLNESNLLVGRAATSASIGMDSNLDDDGDLDDIIASIDEEQIIAQQRLPQATREQRNDDYSFD